MSSVHTQPPLRMPDQRETSRLLALEAQRRTDELHQALEKRLQHWIIVVKSIERKQVQQDQAEAAVAVVQQMTAAAVAAAAATQMN